jgi:hypothetical protein
MEPLRSDGSMFHDFSRMVPSETKLKGFNTYLRCLPSRGW